VNPEKPTAAAPAPSDHSIRPRKSRYGRAPFSHNRPHVKRDRNQVAREKGLAAIRKRGGL
jgi:hypothetical protein